MSLFSLDMQSLFVPSGETPPAATSGHSNAARPRSGRPSGEHAPATRTPREGMTSAHASQPPTAKSSPAMKPQALVPPQPPIPALPHAATTAPPHRQRRSSSPPAVSRHFRSLTPTSSSDSDDDFVYMLGHVNTTEEAVKSIREVQDPDRAAAKRATAFFSRSLVGSTTSPMQPTPTAAASSRATGSGKMRGDLPATMEEFYECPRYTVSLTAARGALFSDALSGFHSYVEREEEQRDELRALTHQQQRQNQQQHRPSAKHASQYTRTHDTQGGIVRTSVVPVFSTAMAQEWNAALDVSAGPAERKQCSAPAEQRHTAPAQPPAREALPATTAPPLTTAAAPTTTTTGATTAEQEQEPRSPHVPASYIFLMRSRDKEALSPALPPAHAPRALSESFEAPSVPAADPAAPQSVPAAAPPVQRHAECTPAPPSPPPAPAPAPTYPTRRLETAQLQAQLQERIHQRARVPEVFRFRYSPDFGETIDEFKHRQQLLDSVLHNHERLSASRTLTQAERQVIMSRYADPNSLEREWPYVWEQFVRDIPRETLFIEDTPYHEADDALAAILSYLEYCYDRSQKHIKEKSAAALAAATSAGRSPAPSHAAAMATPPPPPASQERGFFESFLTAGTAALKGAVVTMRASLPDFVGDPLLAVSGYDPALYHASLLFPTDPKARSEKVFTAVREVVLASQQSFMGFPYQLLCEQVGTERLGLALEALEQEPATDDELDDETETERTARLTPLNEEEPRASPSTCIDVSAPIPISRSDGGGPLKHEMSSPSSSCHSPLTGSRVLRIYNYSSPTSLSQRDSGAAHHHRQLTNHGMDDWNVSSSSDRAPSRDESHPTPNKTPASTPPPPPQVVSAPPTHAVAAAAAAAEQGAVSRQQAGEVALKQLPRPAPLLITRPEPITSAPSAAVVTQKEKEAGKERLRRQKAAQRRRERRRRRRGRLPLLVGEPRAFEFAAFIDQVRSRVAAKEVRDERRAREQQRRDRVQRMLEWQRELWRGAATTTRQGLQPAPSAPLDSLRHATGAAPPATNTPSKGFSGAGETAGAAGTEGAPATRPLFRQDVEGSAYLMPLQRRQPPAASASVPRPPLSGTSERETALSSETRGMRICLYFDEKRNAPVVVVNKLFRLFTMPGLGGLTSSEEEDGGGNAVVANVGAEKEGHHEKGVSTGRLSLSETPPVHQQRALSPRPASREKSLLLLIQVQFSLFTQEEAEVRWKWWKL